jgi:3-oxoadipate enol-lactonase
MPPASIWDERIALAQSKGTPAFVEPMATRWLTQRYRERQPEVVAKIGAMIAGTSVDGMVGCSRAIQAMDHLPILPLVEVPTLVVVGEHDVGTPLSAAQTLHREVAHSRLVVIEDAAHLANIEQTDVFNRTISAFLSSV